MVIVVFFQLNTVEHGMDVNVTDVWRHNVTGLGVTVAAVDDGTVLVIINLTKNPVPLRFQ